MSRMLMIVAILFTIVGCSSQAAHLKKSYLQELDGDYLVQKEGNGSCYLKHPKFGPAIRNLSTERLKDGSTLICFNLVRQPKALKAFVGSKNKKKQIKIVNFTGSSEYIIRVPKEFAKDTDLRIETGLEYQYVLGPNICPDVYEWRLKEGRLYIWDRKTGRNTFCVDEFKKEKNAIYDHPKWNDHFGIHTYGL